MTGVLLCAGTGAAVAYTDYCESPTAASWKYRHCMLRNLYYDMITYERLPDGEMAAGADIERQWHRCVWDLSTTLPAADMKDTLATCRRSVLPSLQNDRGIIEGRKNFEEQARNLQQMIVQVGRVDAEEPCSQRAHESYLKRVPSLSRSAR
jgi:hypothetical protein